MKLKTVEINGKVYAETQEGKPVYDDNGKDIAYDVALANGKQADLGRENQRLRADHDKAVESLKAFEGIDADRARDALKTVENLGAGELKTAAQVDEIKTEARKNAERQVADAMKQSSVQIDTLTKERDESRGQLANEKVTNAFANSKFAKDKTIVPPDMLQALFGNKFKYEDGKLVGYDAAGNKVYSRRGDRGGELADFDEMLELSIEAYPHRNQILKGTGSQGSGSRQGNGANGGGQKTMSRAHYETLPPLERNKAIMVDKVTLVDE